MYNVSFSEILGVYNHYLDLDIYNSEFIVRSSATDVLYKTRSANTSVDAVPGFEELTDFITRLQEVIYNTSSSTVHIESKLRVPSVILRPVFNTDDVNSDLLLQTLYGPNRSPLADRIAVVCTNARFAAKVAVFAPRFVAFTFEADHSSGEIDTFAKVAQVTSPESTHVLLPTITVPPVTVAALRFTTPDFINGTMTWRKAYPTAKILLRYVDTWEQLLWGLEQHVDGFISNNALDIRVAVLTWFRSNCHFKKLVYNSASLPLK